MTIIAFKDGVIAADTQVFSGSLKIGHTKKIAKNKAGDLIGATGNGGWCYAIKQWFEEGEDGAMPSIQQEATGEETGKALVIRVADPTVAWMLFSNPRHYPDKVTIRPRVGIAVGAGCFEAMGAMYAGADAVKGVEAAIALNDGCGGSVDWERLGWS